MADRLRFHPLVESDLSDAVRWYDEISVAVGNRFREFVDTRFDDVAAHPEQFAIVFDDVRFARVKRFPYIILFREHRDVVHVLGVFHGASDTEEWQRRAESK